jgi:pyrimidine operon attenuation protein/uracil phosphoribosyltransferase
MSDQRKPIPKDWIKLIDAEIMSKCITRISYEILEKGIPLGSLAIVGIHTGGEYIARRIHACIQKIENREIDLGVIDITLYRDDLSHAAAQPIIKATDLPFDVDDSHIILVDDVFYTGRTIRAALDAIIDFGRPNCIELAVLMDRGHRELPIRADYVGKNIPTKRNEFVRVRLEEMGYEDAVYLITAENNRVNK